MSKSMTTVDIQKIQWAILVIFYSLIWGRKYAFSEPRMYWCFCFPVPQELSPDVYILINLECRLFSAFYPQIQQLGRVLRQEKNPA